MKSKFLLIMIFIFSLIGINAFAETFEINLENKPEFILIKEYDGDVITKLQCVKPDADKNTVTFESDSEKISALALYGNETKTVDFVKIEQEIINPETPEKEENIKDNNSDNKKEFPEVYDIEKDAVRALLVVSSVSSAFKDGENITELKLFLHGEERIIYLPEDITIQNCPEFYSDLNNQPATSLKKAML